MPYNLDTMANEIDENLGYPDQKTELSLNTTKRILSEALAEFNKRVGKWTIRHFAHTANVQTYNTATLFTGVNCRKIRYLFNGNSLLEKEEDGVTKQYLVMANAAQTSVASGTDIDTLTSIQYGSLVGSFDFDFIEPSTLILLPPPATDCYITCIVQEDYALTDLIDTYYALVRSYAQSQCQEIVGNARARLNSVARTSEIARYTNREKFMYERADVRLERFEKECNDIIIGRMRLVSVR